MPAAVSILLTALIAQSVEPPAENSAPNAPSVEALLPLLRSSDSYDKRRAMEGFLRLGKRGVPSLVEVLREGRKVIYLSEATKLSADILHRLGGKAIGAIPTMLEDLNESEQHYTVALIRLLGRIGPHAPQLHAAIRTELSVRFSRRRHVWLKSACLDADHRLDVDPRTSVKALVQILCGKNPIHRMAVCEILADRGRAAQAAVPALRRLMDPKFRHPSRVPGKTYGKSLRILNPEPLRQKVAIALTRVSPSKDVPLAAWVLLLSNKDPMRRLDAARALGRRGRDARTAVGDLIRAVHDDDRHVSWAAIEAIGLIGPAAEGARETLRELLRDGTPEQKVRVTVALQRLGAN